MTTILDALRNELGFLNQRPNSNPDRVKQVEAEIAAEEAKQPAPEMETATVEAPEKAVKPKPVKKTAE